MAQNQRRTDLPRQSHQGHPRLCEGKEAESVAGWNNNELSRGCGVRPESASRGPENGIAVRRGGGECGRSGRGRAEGSRARGECERNGA